MAISRQSQGSPSRRNNSTTSSSGPAHQRHAHPCSRSWIRRKKGSGGRRSMSFFQDVSSFLCFTWLDIVGLFFCISKYGSPFLRVSWITEESCHLMHKRCLNVASSVSLTWVASRRKKCGPRLSLCRGFRSCGDKKHESMMGIIRYAY